MSRDCPPDHGIHIEVCGPELAAQSLNRGRAVRAPVAVERCDRDAAQHLLRLDLPQPHQSALGVAVL